MNPGQRTLTAFFVASGFALIGCPASLLNYRYRRTRFDLLRSDYELRLCRFKGLPSTSSCLQLNLSRRLRTLYDHLSEPAEQRTPWLLVALLTIGITIAHTDDFSRPGNGELDHIVRSGYRPAFAVESFRP